MITLYELRWSHYCEKIRLVLDFMGVAWQSVSVHPFNKREIKEAMQGQALPGHLQGHTVPALLDEPAADGTRGGKTQGHFVMDSTPILRYLCATYPQAGALMPQDNDEAAAVDAALLEFDTMLGLPARRVGYTQVILECPDLLSDLFLSRFANGFFCLPGVRTLAGHVMGMLLCKRFGLHWSAGMGLYGAMERYLTGLTERLEGRPFVVGNTLSLADLALAAQLRPLTIVPFFADNPQLQPLFERHRAVLARYSKEGLSAYQLAINKVRQHHLPVRRKLLARLETLPFSVNGHFAGNDQQPVWTWSTWLIPFHYGVTLRTGTFRQQRPSVLVR